MSPLPIELKRQAHAIVALRTLFLTPEIEVLSRAPDGTEALRFLGQDGSHADLVVQLPPSWPATP